MNDEQQKQDNYGCLTLIALVLTLALGAVAHAAEPIAFVLCGGNSAVNEFPAANRISNYVDAAAFIGPQLKKAGVKRVLYHNPGGNHWLGWAPSVSQIGMTTPEQEAERVKRLATETLLARDIGVNGTAMWPNQWLLAEQSSCRFADRRSLKLGHEILRYYGVTEVIYYVGSPSSLTDAERDGPACVEMFLACGEGASVGFDAAAWQTRWKPGDDICRFYDGMRAKGHKVYVEPRLSKGQVDAGLGQHIDGTVARIDWDDPKGFFKPDLSIQPGEIIRDMSARIGTLPVPEGVTPMWRGNANWSQP